MEPVEKNDRISFDQVVKETKAAAWLLLNDPLVSAFANHSRQGPVKAILCAIDCTNYLQRRVTAVASTMTVTDFERRNGYSLPPDIAEWSAFDKLEDDNRRLRAALRRCREAARNNYCVTTLEFAAMCDVSAKAISDWTSDPIATEPDFKD